MSQSDLQKYADERAKELTGYAILLANSGLCDNVGPLHQAIADCRTRKSQIDGTDVWGYDLDRLAFKINVLPNVIPRQIDIVTLELSLKLRAFLRTDNNDPLSKLDLNLRLSGEYGDTPPRQKVLCCWHLDRDLHAPSDGAQEFMHPRYHFHHGGYGIHDSIEEHKLDYGASLILESPRIPHPPMDAILGIDFVLTNYYPAKKLDIRNEQAYRKLLEASQKRFWRPYAFAVASIWPGIPASDEWIDHRLWPQVVQ